MNYQEFLQKKTQLSGEFGFTPLFMPDFLFDFQKHLVEWSIKKGRSAIFADCGLGKTPMQLVWAKNVALKTKKPVLIATPLAVSYQVIEEGKKFDIKVNRSIGGNIDNDLIVTNYERLQYFNSNDFAGMVCDESSILKNYSGTRKAEITDFMRKMKYRLLCTATAAPNDYIELGTSAEALGELGYMDMLGRFFKNMQGTSNPVRTWGEGIKWRLKKHAERDFWRWIASWSTPLRKPSDLGYDDNGFILPNLIESNQIIKAKTARPGMLFDLAAVGLKEQREDLRRTLTERCEKAAEIAAKKEKCILWCHLNKEGDLLEKLIPGAKQVSGSNSDEYKERTLIEFAKGDLQYLITKPKIGAFGLNLQSCSNVIYFPSHSYEQYYQAVRRCWRFGQKKQVNVYNILTEGQINVIKNLQRKSKQADQMFDSLIEHVNNPLNIKINKINNQKITIPWN